MSAKQHSSCESPAGHGDGAVSATADAEALAAASADVDANDVAGDNVRDGTTTAGGATTGDAGAGGGGATAASTVGAGGGGTSAPPLPPRRPMAAGAHAPGAQQSYVLVGKAMADAAKSLGDTPNVGEIVFGVRQLMREQALRDRRDPPKAPRKQITDAATVRDLLWWHKIVDGSYEPDLLHLLHLTGLEEGDVLEAQFTVGVMRPSYYLAKDDTKRRVFLVIRGTHSLHDVLTDVAAASQPFLGSSAHRGMVHAAQWFYANVASRLLEEGTKRPEYDVFVAGHSLGAGTAALLCMLLQARAPGVRAICFAPPACVAEALCSRFNECISSVVLHRDIVPRFSTAALRELLDRVAGTDWKRIVREEFTRDVGGLRKRVLEYEGVVKLAAAARDVADVTKGAVLAARDADAAGYDLLGTARTGAVAAAQITAGAYLAARDSDSGRAVADGVSRVAASTADGVKLGARASLEAAASAWQAAKKYPSVNEAIDATAAGAAAVSEHPTVQAASRAAVKTTKQAAEAASRLWGKLKGSVKSGDEETATTAAKAPPPVPPRRIVPAAAPSPASSGVGSGAGRGAKASVSGVPASSSGKAEEDDSCGGGSGGGGNGGDGASPVDGKDAAGNAGASSGGGGSSSPLEVMMPPGCIIHLQRAPDAVFAAPVSNDAFTTIVMGPSLVRDHMMNAYGAALRAWLLTHDAKPETDL